MKTCVAELQESKVEEIFVEFGVKYVFWWAAPPNGGLEVKVHCKLYRKEHITGTSCLQQLSDKIVNARWWKKWKIY